MLLIWLSGIFLVGVWIASVVVIPAIYWFVLSLICLLLAGVFLAVHPLVPAPHWFPRLASLIRGSLAPLAHPLTVGPFLLLAVFFLGAGRLQSNQPDLLARNFIAAYNDSGEPLTVTGLVVEPPDVRDGYISLRIAVEKIRLQGTVQHQEVRGTFLARIEPGQELHYGDRVALTGLLETPPENEDFSYRTYLERQGVYAYMSRARLAVLETGQGNPVLAAVFTLKGRALEMVYRLFPDPEASLLAGILLGVDTGIPRNLQDAFRDTGTTHIIAISGFNISIIAGLFALFFGRLLGKRRGAWASVTAISLYTILVGADAAVVRAAVMGTLAILARGVGRRQDGFTALLFSAAAMTYFNPQILWDVGFQLSFAATLGLLLYADLLTGWFAGLAARWIGPARAEKMSGPVSEFFLLTFAAQATTLPLIIYYFKRISVISFLVNPLILPVQPEVMILGGLAVICGMLFFPLGKLVAPFAWVFIAYTIRIVEWMARIPRGVIPLGKVSLPLVVLIYLVLFGLTFAWVRSKKIFSALQKPAFLGVLALLVVVTWQRVLSAPDGNLHLIFFNVGSGEAVLIRSPAGRYVLIDGGPSSTLLSDGLGRRMPFGNRAIDFLVVAHPVEAGVAALPRNMERFPPSEVLWAGSPNTSRAARTLRETLTGMAIPIVTAEAGQILDLGDGTTLQVLTVGKRGAILLLARDRFRFLLPLGADYESLAALGEGAGVGPVTGLFLADSGEISLNPPEWIANLHPRLTVLSVGAGDPHGLPSPETIAALDGYSLLRTDRNGWIHVASDGHQMWVETEKGY